MDEALAALARQGADSFGYRAELRIDRTLAQLLRLRVAQINGCGYCLELHDRVARAAGIPDPVVATLAAWWQSDIHDAPARAALDYAEALTRLADPTVARHVVDRQRALARHFTPQEATEIVGVVINMNIWTRLKVAEAAALRLTEEAGGANGRQRRPRPAQPHMNGDMP